MYRATIALLTYVLLLLKNYNLRSLSFFYMDIYIEHFFVLKTLYNLIISAFSI